jgi:hypothetical protein
MAASRGRHQFSSDEEEDLHEEMPNYMAGDYGVGEEHLEGFTDLLPNMLRHASRRLPHAAFGQFSQLTKRGGPTLPALKSSGKGSSVPAGRGKAPQINRAQQYEVADPAQIKLLTLGHKQGKAKKQKQQDAAGAGNPVSVINALAKLLQAATGTVTHMKQVGTGGGSKSAKKKKRQWKNAERDAWAPAEEGKEETQEEKKARRRRGQEEIKAAESDPALAQQRYDKIHDQLLPAARAKVQSSIDKREEYITGVIPMTMTLFDILKRDTIDVPAIRVLLVRVQKFWDDEVHELKRGPYTLTKKLLGEVETEPKVYRALARRWLVKNARKWLKANHVTAWEKYKELTKAIRKASKENNVRNLKRSADHWYSVLHPREKEAE